MSESESNAEAPRPNAVRFALLLGIVLVGLVAARVWWPPGTSVHPSGVEPREVDNPELGVTFAAIGIEGLPREVIVACDERVTVFEAFRRVVAVEPAWEFEYLGSDDRIFVNNIAGHLSQGRGGSNWVYEVNGEMAARGVAEIEVGPGDHVLWKFEPLE